MPTTISEEPEFSIRYYPRYLCDTPTCTQQPVAEIHLYDAMPHTGHAQVCGQHIEWAKAHLIKRNKELVRRHAMKV